MDLIAAMVGSLMFGCAYGAAYVGWQLGNTLNAWGLALFWTAFVLVGPLGVLTLYFLARAIWFGGAA